MSTPEFDPGPPPAIAAQLAAVPDYAPHKEMFWFDWGPVFYRGRLDGSAKVICVASDPGPTERIAHRTLVGDAGQRVQGFLAKLGLTRSYVCVNAFAYALFPSSAFPALAVLEEKSHMDWRNGLLDSLKASNTQAVVAFGMQAQKAVSLWPGRASLPVQNVPHPSSHDEAALLEAWRQAVVTLRASVTPDPDGDAHLPNYGTKFTEADYTAIPRRDLPFGVPAFLGDDKWLRTGHGKKHSSVTRPHPDDRHTLIWISPTT